MTEKHGEIIYNVKRMQALTQINSEHGIMRGEDVVEEVLYTHKRGILPHRIPASARMYFIKTHNIDLNAALVCCVLAGPSLLITGAYKFYLRTKVQKELKTL